MITWLAPLALALLAVVPVLWWLHRRQPKPAVVTVPSLLFLEDEAPNSERPERRRVDADLLLAIAAAAMLALAAAQPVLGVTSDGRRIVVLRDASVAMTARSADGTTASDRASAATQAIERLSSGSDRFETVAASGDELARRLRDASAGLRVLVSDRRPAELPIGVLFVGVGDKTASNVGIVAVDVDVVGGRRRVFATIWNDAAAPRTLRAGPPGVETDVHCPAFGAARASWDVGPVPRSGAPAPIAIHLIDDGGALASDDTVVIDPSPMHVAFARDALAPVVEAATRRALDAIFVGGWTEDAAAEGGLFVGPARDAPKGARLVLEIGRVPTGVDPVRPRERDAVETADPRLGRDLDLATVEWVYPAGASAHAPWPRVTIDRVGAPSPVLVRWHADPSLGRPAAIDTPLWPLFIENVIRLIGAEAVGGGESAAGRRWTGVLDLDVTRLGRDVAPFDRTALDAAPRDVSARRRVLSPWFAGVGSICLSLLWFRPRKGTASPVR